MRSRFRQGWGLAWGVASVAIMIATRGADSGVTVVAYPSPMMSESARTLVLYLGCAIGAGIGSYVAMTAMNVGERARRWVAVLWTLIALLLVVVNVYLLDHPGPDWWYEWNVTLPIAGALGGLIQSFVTKVIDSLDRLKLLAAWLLLWSLAFLAARYVGVIGVYLLGGGVIDLFETVGLSPKVGGDIGWFAGGYLAGYVMGAIASFSPGIVWRSPGLKPRGSIPQ